MFRGLVQRVRRLGAVTAVLIGGFMAVSSAEAMRVSPMVSELTTTGAGSAARIEVGNIGSSAMPFETIITQIEMDGEGQLTETPADENFLVFPPQGLVPANGRQVVRVQWVGEPNIDTSKAYYLWVRQLPIETAPSEDGGGAVQVSVLYTMKALIVVAPPGAQPDVQVESAKPASVAPPAAEIDPSLSGGQQAAPPEEPGLEVTVVNRGKRYALMSGATWIVTGTDLAGQPYSQTLSGQTVAETVGVGYLAPAGGRRVFKIPTGGVALDPSKPVTVRFAR
ncbi:MAG: fimbria/pilus periplasmic chaperone [Brevundimonas sp.]|uniref:fimbria/pilus periplasmic chaperone n=1 Tax=Brevundimonas sp. TaxID=1871086 RepID=UPI003919EC1A